MIVQYCTNCRGWVYDVLLFFQNNLYIYWGCQFHPISCKFLIYCIGDDHDPSSNVTGNQPFPASRPRTVSCPCAGRQVDGGMSSICTTCSPRRPKWRQRHLGSLQPIHTVIFFSKAIPQYTEEQFPSFCFGQLGVKDGFQGIYYILPFIFIQYHLRHIKQPVGLRSRKASHTRDLWSITVVSPPLLHVADLRPF